MGVKLDAAPQGTEAAAQRAPDASPGVDIADPGLQAPSTTRQTLRVEAQRTQNSGSIFDASVLAQAESNNPETAGQQHNEVQPDDRAGYTPENVPEAEVVREQFRILREENLSAQFEALYQRDLQQLSRFPEEKQTALREAGEGVAACAAELVERRAVYNLTGDRSVLDVYLPKRAVLANDPEKLAQYDKLVSLIMEKSDIRLWTTAGPEPKLEGAAPADESACYLFAASAVEGLHQRPDLIRRVTDRDKPLGVVIATPNPTLGTGLYSPAHVVTLTNAAWLYRMAFEPRQHNLGFHEFVHGVDGEKAGSEQDPYYFADGVISEMAKERDAGGRSLLDRFEEVRDRLFAISGYADLSIPERRERINAQELDPATMLPTYVYYDKKEFLAETMRAFIDNPELFHTPGSEPEALALKQELHALYTQFLRQGAASSFESPSRGE